MPRGNCQASDRSPQSEDRRPETEESVWSRGFGFYGLAILAVLPVFAQGGQRPFPANRDRCAALLANPSASGAPEVDPRLAAINEVRAKLRARLGIYNDPFALASTTEKGEAIWEQLAGAFPPLTQARDAVDAALRAHRELDPKLEQTILSKAAAAAASPATSLQELAGAADSLRRLALLHIRDAAPKPPEPEPPKPAKGSSKDQQPSGKKKKSPPPPYPDMPTDYQAGNKDSEQSGDGDSPEVVSIASVDKAGIRYFRMRAYQVVDAVRNRFANIETPHPPLLTPTHVSEHTLRVKPLGRTGQELGLLLPQGFVPVTFHSDRGYVKRDESGNYVFNTTGEELEVALLPQGVATRPLSPSERDIYVAPTGSKLTDWPEHLQQAVLNLRSLRESGKFSGPQADVELAQVLGDYIAKHFKYRVDADPPTSAAELARKGAFQCDTAAVIWTAILRDELGIAARPVGGFRGSMKLSDAGSSHVAHPSQGHAWGEVADTQGNWWGVDPTPLEKDRETNEKSGDSDFRQIGDTDQKPQEGDDQGDGQPSDKNAAQKQAGKGAGGDPKREGKFDGAPREGGEGKSIDELIKEVKSEQARKKAQRDTQKGAGAGKGAGTDPEKAETREKAGDPSSTKEKTEKLIRDLDERNPLVRRLLTRAALRALDPSLPTATKIQRLNNLKSLLGKDREGFFPALGRLKAILSEATTLFGENRPPFELWAEKILKDAPTTPLNHVSDELVLLQRQIDYTLKFMDPAPMPEASPLAALARRIQDLRDALGRIRHPDSEAIRIADEMYGKLPGNISRRIIRERFGLGDGIGANLATLNLSKAISKGELNDFRLMSILGPMTEFVVDPVPKPSRGERLTWDPALKRQKGRYQVLMTGDPRTRNRWVRVHTEYSDDEAIARGDMGVLLQRRRITVPDGHEDTEPEKVTIIPFDCSGSMRGDNAYFQSEYIGALVDRALSDPVGRHRVYLFPFTEEIFDPIEVTTPEQARALIRDLQGKTGNRDGGTNIEKALLKVAEILRDANRTGDKALARATIVLTSDGGSTVDAETVRKAFQAVGGKTTILMAFVAIGGSNPALVELAESSRRLGADAGMYIEWSAEDISRILGEAKAPARAINDFWTDQPFSALPSDARAALSELQREIGRYRSATALAPGGTSLLATTRALQSQVETLVPGRKPRRERGHVARIKSLRRVLNLLGDGFSPLERGELLEETLSVWAEAVPEPIRELAEDEVAEIFHLFSWPATGVSGVRAEGDPR